MTAPGLYVRISKDRSGERAGVGRQEADCRALCERRGWPVAGVYVDNDLSAYSGKPRPAYRRMLDDLRASRIDAVVAWHNDRLHRRPIELEEFITIIEQTGAVVAIVEGGDYDLSTPDGRLAARIVGAVARKESEDKSRRLRRFHDDRAKRGLPAGGQRPFGYDVVRVDGDYTWVINEVEAGLIREAAKWLLDGRSVRSLVVDWQRRGIPTSVGKEWNTIGIHRVMTSARIAGYRVHGSKSPHPVETPAAWPAIIDVDTLAEIRSYFADPSRTTNGGVRARRYLLAGFLFCGRPECGSRLHARPRSDKRRAYVCASGPGFGGCGKIRALAEELENHVRDVAIQALCSEKFRAKIEAAVGEPDEVRELHAHVRNYRSRLEALDTARWVDGSLDPDAHLRLKAEIESRVDVLERRLAVVSIVRPVQHLPTDPAELHRLWADRDLHWRREVLATVVERVVVRPAVKGRNFFDPSRVDVVLRD